MGPGLSVSKYRHKVDNCTNYIVLVVIEVVLTGVGEDEVLDVDIELQRLVQYLVLVV